MTRKWLSWLIGLVSVLGMAFVAVLLVIALSGKTVPVTQAETTTPPGTSAATTQPANAAAPAPAAATAGPDRYISVTTVGQVMAPPDVAYLSVGAEVQATTAKDALDKATTTGEKIRQALVAAGIPGQNIQTNGVNAYPVTPSTKDGLPAIEPSSYRADINLNITINDLGKAGTALDAATKAGANRVGGVSYAIKDDSALRAKALEQAVQQARPKAEALARGLNLQLGQVLTVVEDPNGYYGPVYGGGKGSGGQLSPGELNVSVKVVVTYAIG